MSYPKTGHEVYVSLNLSNTMLTTLGRATITRDQVSADEMKRLFQIVRHSLFLQRSGECDQGADAYPAPLRADGSERRLLRQQDQPAGGNARIQTADLRSSREERAA